MHTAVAAVTDCVDIVAAHTTVDTMIIGVYHIGSDLKIANE